MRRTAVPAGLLVVSTCAGLVMNVVRQAVADDRVTAAAAAYDRPSGDPHQSRSAVVAQHGIVATSQPLAAQAGLDILQAGGNAADAAITTCAMLGVVEPMNCGLGGDLFLIYWDSKTERLYGLNASGRSPYGLSRDLVRRRGLAEIPAEGLLSWTVPGCVSGWDALRRRFGTLDFDRLLAPAIEAAAQGFPVSEIIADDWRKAEKGLARWPDSAATYLVEGRAPRCGEIFRNPRLAASLRAIAAGGARAFYEGDIAEQIVRFARARGGLWTQQDFTSHQAEWVDPVSTNYRGYDVWALPPNGQGLVVLEMLNLLEPYDLGRLGPGHPEYLHLLVEAKKLAFADRARFYADPAFADLPIRQLASKSYARQQGRRIDRDRAATDVPAGDPNLAAGDTVYLAVVDKDRNCCSMIQSVFHAFGSQVVPGEVGFVMQNRGALFALDPTHVNRLEPHKRPFHTIIPALVTKQGRPWYCFGVMGGDMQPQGQVQILVGLIDFRLNIQAAGDAARLRHLGSATPTGRPATAGGGTVRVESGIPDEAVAALQAKGHHVVRGGTDFGGYQGIFIDWQHGTLQGGSEPRKDGAAVGY